MPEHPPPGPVQGEILTMVAEASRRRQERHGQPQRFPFLADPQDIMSLALAPADLTVLEGLTRSAAARVYRDAGLSAFTLAVRPFARPDDLGGACLFTYSTDLGRTRVTFRVDPYGIVEPAAPSEDAQALPEAVFPALPWEADPGWRATLRQAYAAVGPLAPHEFSAYYVSARARFPGRWEAIFQDGKSGRESVFEWTASGGLTRRK
ncbi:MAG: hypothetical protein HY330_04185 [Chloroflexi bacterium]|nr:hypothetical protein [Chloroflexota bacterium]